MGHQLQVACVHATVWQDNLKDLNLCPEVGQRNAERVYLWQSWAVVVAVLSKRMALGQDYDYGYDYA
jgi:hypothetical protein